MRFCAHAFLEKRDDSDRSAKKEQETTPINCFSVSEFSRCMEQISNLMYGLCYTQALYYLEQIETALKENKETLEYELVAKYHLFYI